MVDLIKEVYLFFVSINARLSRWARGWMTQIKNPRSNHFHRLSFAHLSIKLIYIFIIFFCIFLFLVNYLKGFFYYVFTPHDKVICSGLKFSALGNISSMPFSFFCTHVFVKTSNAFTYFFSCFYCLRSAHLLKSLDIYLHH